MVQKLLIRFALLSAFALSFPVGCSSDEEEEPEPATCDPSAIDPGCKDARVCEAVVGGEGKCFDAYTIQGKVFDTQTNQPVEGAHVVARDADGAAVSGVAVSDKDGNYELPVPVTRNAEGGANDASLEVLLRADAHGYVSFPKPPRSAVPIDVIKATGEPPVIESAATDIGLVPIEDATAFGTISGQVIADNPGGTLVVSGTSTAVADLRGGFTLFNVPAGSATVSGYLSGVTLEPKTVDVVAQQTTEDVELRSIGEATATVSGSVTFVNPGSGITSVILVVKDTFDPLVARGESPPGLKDLDVSGPFEIANVPDGTYVVLAAFDTDGFVRDPDTSIGGTELVEITVAGQSLSLTDSFKVTGALETIAPTGEAVVTGTPTFEWADDASEKRYSIVVFDALGTQIWEKTDVPEVNSGGTVSQIYEGPALTPGMIYQFKATSWSADPGGTPLSQTEDLEGVFIFE